MSDETKPEETKPGATAVSAKPRMTGLGPKAQKLQALRDKAAGKSASHTHDLHNAGAKGAAGFKKTNFQRKAT